MHIPFCCTTPRCSLNQRQFAQIIKDENKEIFRMGEYRHRVVWGTIAHLTKNLFFGLLGRKSTLQECPYSLQESYRSKQSGLPVTARSVVTVLHPARWPQPLIKTTFPHMFCGPLRVPQLVSTVSQSFSDCLWSIFSKMQKEGRNHRENHEQFLEKCGKKKKSFNIIKSQQGISHCFLDRKWNQWLKRHALMKRLGSLARHVSHNQRV